MLGLGFFLLSWVVSARVVPWRIPWHHSPAALSLCRTNWKIYSLHLASDVLKWDCPAPLSANNEFYENRLISSFAFKILLNSLHPTFSPMHQSKMRPLLKLSWVSNHQSLTLCVHTRVCKLCITMDRLRFVSPQSFQPPRLSSTRTGQIPMNLLITRWDAT